MGVVQRSIQAISKHQQTEVRERGLVMWQAPLRCRAGRCKMQGWWRTLATHGVWHSSNESLPRLVPPITVIREQFKSVLEEK